MALIKKVASGHVKRWRSRIVMLFLVGVILGFVLPMLISIFGLMINVSSTMPYGIYHVEYRVGIDSGIFGFKAINDNAFRAFLRIDNSGLSPQELAQEHALQLTPTIKDNSLIVHKGDLVLVCLDKPLARFAKERGYIASGQCQGGYAPLAQHVVAEQSDTIEVVNDGLKVNGTLLRHSKIADLDPNNLSLPRYADIGSVFTLEEDELMLLDESEHSFDSRYFGPVKRYYVIAKLKPLFTF